MFVLCGRVSSKYAYLVKDYFSSHVWDVYNPIFYDWNEYITGKGEYDMFPVVVKTCSITPELEFVFEGETSPFFPIATMKVLIWEKICDEITDFSLA